MKEKTAPKKTWLQTLRALWVPLAIGIVTVAALALVVGAVWQDYRTALMDQPDAADGAGGAEHRRQHPRPAGGIR